MVSFGLLDFCEREHLITDNFYDGGIDGYFIDTDCRKIFLIQSKFRTTERNFNSKEIALEELLSMEISRILEGHQTDEVGNEYNGKIKQMVREIGETDGIARYKYEVVLLANLMRVTPERLKRLTGGYPVEVFDYDKCYEKLVYPVICGTYFNASDLNIYLDLSNKNAGSKISYSVKTEHAECEITVLFVPTIEIARVLKKYKNSILRHNPRSYLELEGQKVNQAIRETILGKNTNEFALFNNGITMISDETNINERIGQRNKAQLAVRNPQIINGGQTAYTLSRIYEERSEEEAEKAFADKEVLLKVITLADSNGGQNIDSEKIRLIDAISTATNQQTVVIGADRASNKQPYELIQSTVFLRYGLLFERKRGEFGDGLRMKYVSEHQIIERNLFIRIHLATRGEITKASQKKLFLNYETPENILDDRTLDDFYFGYLCFTQLEKSRTPSRIRQRALFGQIYAMTQLYRPQTLSEFETTAHSKAADLREKWKAFVEHIASTNSKFIRIFPDRTTDELRTMFVYENWYRSDDFEIDVKKYFEEASQKTAQ